MTRKMRSLIGFDFACAGFSSSWYAGLVNNVTNVNLSGGNVHSFVNFRSSSQLARSNAFNFCALQSNVFKLCPPAAPDLFLRTMLEDVECSSANSKNQCTINPYSSN